MCGVDVEANKKNRRSLSSSDLCCAVLTDIAQGTSRSRLDLQKFQEGYVCKSCFRELERLSVQEKRVRELRETIESKVQKQLDLHCSSESTRPVHTSHSVSPRSRKRPRSTVESVPTESPDVSVSTIARQSNILI